MPKTKSPYIIGGTTLPEVVFQLQIAMQGIADRLDKLEGIRGDAEISGSLEVLDEDDLVIHSME